MVTDTFRVPHGLMTTGTKLQKPSAIPHHDFHLVPRNFPETETSPENAPLSHGSSIFKNGIYACRQNRVADNQMREWCQVSIRFPIRPQNRATTQILGTTSRQKHSGGLAEYPDAIRFKLFLDEEPRQLWERHRQIEDQGENNTNTAYLKESIGSSSLTGRGWPTTEFNSLFSNVISMRAVSFQ